MCTYTGIHHHYLKTRFPFRLSKSTTANWRKKLVEKQGGYCQRTCKLCFVLDLLRFSHLKKNSFPFCSFPPSVSYHFSGAQTAIFHDHKHLWDYVHLCECVRGVWCLWCWCLKGIKQQVCSWLSLEVFISSLARVGSAICSEATFLPASRHTKKRARTHTPTHHCQAQTTTTTTINWTTV